MSELNEADVKLIIEAGALSLKTGYVISNGVFGALADGKVSIVEGTTIALSVLPVVNEWTEFVNKVKDSTLDTGEYIEGMRRMWRFLQSDKAGDAMGFDW